MKIAIYSNSPGATSGYGVSTHHLTEGLVRLGHEVGVLCNWGYQGQSLFLDMLELETNKPIGSGGFWLFPFDGYGMGEAGAVQMAKAWNADLVIGNYDNWVLNSFAKSLAQEGIPYAPWAMHDWVPEIDNLLWENLAPSTLVVPYTKWAREQFMKHLPRVHEHIYLGVDTEVFRPVIGDKIESGEVITKELMRSKRGFEGGRGDVHITLINKMNKAERPNIPCMIEAWKIFAENNRDVRPKLFLHMNMDQGDGYNLEHIVKSLGIADQVLYTAAFEQSMGLSAEQMSALYNSSDVLLNATMTEGMGLPIVEAMACGVPVVATDAMCMREHLEPVSPELLVKPVGEWWHRAPGKYVILNPYDIADALERSLSRDPERDKVTLSQYIQNTYDWDRVIIPKWQEAIPRILEVAEETCLKTPEPSDELKKRAKPEVI
ncbi:glycosyltransferase family 4 protein [Candidatus Pacearchaeota archaeon]|nr:glycosyltransferase family 4 protein [Candidatus Pacearchaeota archaeon]